MVTRIIKIGKQQISVCESTGAGTPVLFIHGNSLSKASFANQFDSELSAKHQLIAFDLPGHGDSGKPVNPEETYCIPGYVDVLKGVLAKLELTEFYLVGHSLGGHIALEAVPELTNGLKGLFIFGTPPLGNPPDMTNAFLPNPAMGFTFQGELSEGEARALANEFVPGEAPDNIVQSILHTDPNARTYIGASIGQGKMNDEIAIAQNLTVPIAVVHAEKDALINLNYIRSLDIPTLWKQEVQVIAGCGHGPQWENPSELNRLIADFIS